MGKVKENKEWSYVSVVIPTLGNDCLLKTVYQLNLGKITPKEIIICIPKDKILNIDLSSYSNIKIVKTDFYGQVPQRIMGFKSASYDYVMQLDDDVLVDDDCLKYLLERINKYKSRVAVAPSIHNILNYESVYKKPNRNKFISFVYYFLMNGVRGYKPGTIDKTGTPVGIDIDLYEKDVFETEWLAGGCVLHHKDNLVCDNYFPFQGKAYGEDVMHSIKLREMGVKLLIEPKAKCYIEINSSSDYSLIDFVKDLKAEVKIRKYYMGIITNQRKTTNIRINIYYLITIMRYMINKYMIHTSVKSI